MAAEPVGQEMTSHVALHAGAVPLEHGVTDRALHVPGTRLVAAEMRDGERVGNVPSAYPAELVGPPRSETAGDDSPAREVTGPLTSGSCGLVNPLSVVAAAVLRGAVLATQLDGCVIAPGGDVSAPFAAGWSARV